MNRSSFSAQPSKTGGGGETLHPGQEKWRWAKRKPEKKDGRLLEKNREGTARALRGELKKKSRGAGTTDAKGWQYVFGDGTGTAKISGRMGESSRQEARGRQWIQSRDT